tara:strand:+ start:440 stop:949 length:510 start_codon:yes stop_codon:yes gene_type:complete
MDINILKNILMIFIIIILFLILSNDKQYNNYLSKNKVNYLVLLILVYFIYADIPISIIILLLLVVLLLNKNFYNKFILKNKYIKDYLPDLENFDNNSNSDDYDFKPYNEQDNVKSLEKINNEDENNLNEKNNEYTQNEEQENNKTINEPFKLKVQDIKKHINNAINNVN